MIPVLRRAGEPPAMRGYRIYCIVLCVLHLALTVLAFAFLTTAPEELRKPPAVRWVAGGVLFLGVALFVLTFLPLVLERRPWLWTYGLVLICLGMTSACLLPFCIPLLVSWMKPEVKAHFGHR